MLYRFIKVIIFIFMMNSIVVAQDISDTAVPTKHNKELTIGDIAQIQVGLGSVMIEFAHRFHIVYYAAKASNWRLAEYELHELIEAQEIAEITRPRYKKQLKSFEDNYLSKLNKSIKKKSWEKFEKQYTQTTVACNKCHKANGYPYIKYRLPQNSPRYLDMK